MTDDVQLGSRFLRWERRGTTAWVTIDRPEHHGLVARVVPHEQLVPTSFIEKRPPARVSAESRPEGRA
jgi:hypothetical protein